MSLLESPRPYEADRSAAAANGELWTEAEVGNQALICYKVPEFVTQYPLEINCHAAKASKDTYDWLHEHGVDTLLSPKLFRKLIDGDFPGLASRVYVDAGPKGIDWACKYFTWLFAVDDQMDETAIGMSLRSSMPLFLEFNLVLLWSFPEDPVLYENLVKFLDALPCSELQKEESEFIHNTLRKAKECPVSTLYGGKLGPLGSCLQDLWAICLETMPEVYSLRLAHSIQDYFLGNLDEARNRQNKTIPSVEEYKLVRRKTGALQSTMVIVDLVAEVHLPNELFNSAPMQRLLTAINDIICWHNDIWSLKKEISRGDFHNLVFLINHEWEISSYKESALIARQMVYNRTIDLDKAAMDLVAITSPAYEHVVRRYIKTCQNWISGAQAYNLASTRYR